MLVALCQINTVMGDPAGNRDRILAAYDRAAKRGASLVVVPELALPGYPPTDLLEREDFIEACLRENAALAGVTGSAGLVFGTLVPNGGSPGKPILSAAILAAGGQVLAEVHKRLLPTYDVFDEGRYFEPDPEPARPVSFGGIQWGIHICEDAWNEKGFWPRRLYRTDPVEELASNGADALLNLSASPFHLRKWDLRRSMFSRHASRHGLPFLFTNLVGGNDELVFDGEAFVIDARGEILASAQPFREETILVEVHGRHLVVPRESWVEGAPGPEPARPRDLLSVEASAFEALVLGLRDYALKCGFRSAVLGLSGGIDSALTAVLACAALGPGNVWGLSLPGRYSSPGSLADARGLAENLGMRHDVLSIEPVFQGALDSLGSVVPASDPGVVEENIQARARGLLLMALSNRFGHLLLSTGNKSEVVGYTTLYGDMAGGLAVLSDVPKTMVYAIARHVNERSSVIPESTMTKPPSAELRPDQKDQDSLPPYEILDPILQGIVEEGLSTEALVLEGFDRETVLGVQRMVARAEYKRRQAAPGLRITPKAFGRGRRMPIATPWDKA